MLLSIGPVLILVVLIIVLSLASPVFATPRNFGNILAQTAVITVVAMGQHLVILTRGIDLSVGSNLALATVVGALLFHAGGSPAATILAMIASGALVGAVNGLFYVFGRLPHPFIITLATLSICKGVALQLADGRAIPGMPEAIRVLGRNTSFGLPGSVFVVIGVGLVLLVLTRTMVWGRWIYAVGGRPEAALAMGIPVKWVLGIRLRHIGRLRRHRRGHPGRAHRCGLAAVRQSAGARHDRGGDHRRRQLPRRARPSRPCGGRRHHDRRHPQRAQPAQRRRLLPADRHRHHHRRRGRVRRAAQPSRGRVRAAQAGRGS